MEPKLTADGRRWTQIKADEGLGELVTREVVRIGRVGDEINRR